MWIRVDETITAHRKTLRFASRLKIPTAQAIGHLVLLWLWAARYAPDGQLDDLAADELATAVGYPGDPEPLMAALVDVGFLDRSEAGPAIHDWMDYAGSMRETRRKAKQREERRSCPKTVPGQSQDPDARGRDETRRDETIEPPPPPPQNRRRSRDPYTPGFLQAWRDYPHYEQRSSKIQAMQVWTKRKLEPLTERVLLWISAGRSSEDWRKEGGSLVPGMQVWLKKPEFSDEPLHRRNQHLSEKGRRTAEACLRILKSDADKEPA